MRQSLRWGQAKRPKLKCLPLNPWQVTPMQCLYVKSLFLLFLFFSSLGFSLVVGNKNCWQLQLHSIHLKSALGQSKALSPVLSFHCSSPLIIVPTYFALHWVLSALPLSPLSSCYSHRDLLTLQCWWCFIIFNLVFWPPSPPLLLFLQKAEFLLLPSLFPACSAHSYLSNNMLSHLSQVGDTGQFKSPQSASWMLSIEQIAEPLNLVLNQGYLK